MDNYLNNESPREYICVLDGDSFVCNLKSDRTREEQISVAGDYICDLDGDILTCDLKPPIPRHRIDRHKINGPRTTRDRILAFCHNNPSTRVMIRYPRGHGQDVKFLKIVDRYADILFTKSFDITRSGLKPLLSQLYSNSEHIQNSEQVRHKRNACWSSGGRITVYLFEMVEIGQLRRMKKDIREIYETISCIHTSDDYEETIQFISYIFDNYL